MPRTSGWLWGYRPGWCVVAPATALLSSLQPAFACLWRHVKLEPKHKEVFWRLAVGGFRCRAVPLARCAAGDVCLRGRGCQCLLSSRLHHF